MQKLKFLKPALSLIVITVGIALLLALVNSMTANRIKENELEKKREAISEIFPSLKSFDKVSAENLPVNVDEVGIVRDENNGKLGYYVEISPQGFKDAITMIVGIDEKGDVVRVRCLSSSETAGVGTKATDPKKLSDYEGKNVDTVKDVDTITGATISSKAVRDGIEAACSAIEPLKGVN